MSNTCDLCKKATATTDRVYRLALDTVTDILGDAGFELHEFTVEGIGTTAGFAVVNGDSQEVVIPVRIREREYESPVSLDEVIKWTTENILDGEVKKECHPCELCREYDTVSTGAHSEKWDELDEEPYVSVPLVVWQNALISGLKEARDELKEINDFSEDTSYVTAILSGLIGFCQYCEEEHTF